MEDIKKTKKGQIALGDATGIIRILVILAVTLAVSALIIVGFRDNGIAFVPTTVSNESHNVTTTLNVTLDVSTQSRFISISTVYNDTLGSNGVDIASGNYTASEVAGQTLFQLLGVTNTHNGSILNITYSFNADPEDFFSNITDGGLQGLQTFGDFQDLIALVVVAIIILGLVLFIGTRNGR